MHRDAPVLSGPRCALVLCGYVLLSMAAEAGAAIPASERAALIALYNSTNGAGWTCRFNWRNESDTDFGLPGTECEWFGVGCAVHGPGEGPVIRLDLRGNNLSGPIPPEIADLTSLGSLDLSGNQLTGSIPPEIGSLSELTDLRLYSNQLTGSIPPEVGNLANLGLLSLAGNGLSGSIPPQIGSLAKLWRLDLRANGLAGSIPAEIGNLSWLLELSLSDNQLSGSIPPQVGSLARLSALDLGRNQLSGSVPAEVGLLTGLQFLLLEGNQLSGTIPGAIGDLAWLHKMDLSGNQLGGAIPSQLRLLTRLQLLDLAGNQLSGSIPPEIAEIQNLVGLSLNGNQLSGPIPPEIGNLTSLRSLDLSDNQLTGSIPLQIGRLSMGYSEGSGTLRLDHNQLSGPIPSTIGHVRYLGTLALDHNQLTGPIPPGIGGLTRLVELALAANQLMGPMPATLANLTNLADGMSDLRWNALYTDDPALRAFLASKQIGGDWESTQTVAPSGLVAGSATLDGVPLSWSPILYTGDAGSYRVWYGTRPGGPYNLGGITADKAASTSTVGGLSPGTTYYFALDTTTEPHADNQNTVVSERSVEVSATTTLGGVDWPALTVDRRGSGGVSSSPGAIACGGACSATFAPGTPVALTAAPEPGSTFLGWGGACAGAAPTCDLTMDSARTVAATFSTPATSYYTVTPCRVFDSRDPGLGGFVALAAGTNNPVQVGGYCGDQAAATAVSLNVTVVSPSAGGHLRLFASGAPRPGTSSINYVSGQTRANNAVVSLGADGALTVSVNQPSGTAHVVLDVNGYFQ
jgi:Leucine-rich repeat (LRR) protein